MSSGTWESGDHYLIRMHDADIVGVGARGYITPGNTSGRAFCMNTYTFIPPTSYGHTYGIEVNVDNRSDKSLTGMYEDFSMVPDAPNSQYGMNLTTKSTSNPATAAIILGSSSNWNYGLWAAQGSFYTTNANARFIELNNLMAVDTQGRIAVGHNSPTEHIHIKRDSGNRSQLLLESDAAGGEESTRYTDTGTRNWTTGLWNTTGRYTITSASTLGSSQKLEIDSNGNFGFNGFSAGSGQGNLFIANTAVAPSGNPVGGGIMYVEGGALKYKGSSGTVTTLGAA
tara:strand:- start:78 stop:929 length:852 start_codon:yes stop_codon:yes gene_type:complete